MLSVYPEIWIDMGCWKHRTNVQQNLFDLKDESANIQMKLKRVMKSVGIWRSIYGMMKSLPPNMT